MKPLRGFYQPQDAERHQNEKVVEPQTPPKSSKKAVEPQAPPIPQKKTVEPQAPPIPQKKAVEPQAPPQGDAQGAPVQFSAHEKRNEIFRTPKPSQRPDLPLR
jgi:hypothetical protein